MKKVLILYVAIGSGHKQVAKYIGEHLNNHYKDEVEVKLLDNVEYANKFWFQFYRKLFVYNFNIISIKARRKLYEKIENQNYFLNNYDSLLVKNFANKRMEKFLKQYNPDIVVSTMFGSSQVIGKFKKKGVINSPLITVITDNDAHLWYTRYHEYTNYYIVNNNSMKQSMIEKMIDAKKIKNYGIPISEKFNDNFNIGEIKAKNNIDNDKKVILVFGGGGYGFDLIIPYYEKILSLGSDFISIFVAGENKKLFKKAVKLSKKYNQTSYVYGFINNVNEMMAISDLIVTKPGGITVTECMRMNKITILVNSVGGQEDSNIDYVVKNNCGFYSENVIKFEKILNDLINDDRLRFKTIQNLQKMDKPNSVDKVCRLIVDVLYKKNDNL